MNDIEHGETRHLDGKVRAMIVVHERERENDIEFDSGTK